MTGELHNVRHLIVPPNGNTHRLHLNTQEYLDNPNVGLRTENRRPVAEMSPWWNYFRLDIWGVIGVCTCLLSAIWVIVALFALYMVLR